MDDVEFQEAGLALLRHKDILRKQILEIKREGDCVFEIERKTGKVKLHISLNLPEAKPGTIVVENTKKNRDLLAANWELFVKNQTTIIFLERNSPTNWSICPYIHEKIKGNSHVRKDLDSLATNA